MASSTLQKLLRNQTRTTSKILACFRSPIPPLPLTQTAYISNPIDPISNHTSVENLKPNLSCNHVYPLFPFGFFLNPNNPTSLIRPETDGESAQDDSNVIRADSVKKKRKRKMNKHKLKKLRKNLRRKT